MVMFKQKCFRCKKNYVKVGRNQRFVVCYDCQKKEMQGEVKDPKNRKMFDIPEDFYKENSFLRDIKVKAIMFGELTENQINAFKKTVARMKEEAKSK